MRIYWFLFVKTRIPSTQGCFFAMFVWNWPSSSVVERRFLNLSMYFRYCVIMTPWKKAWPFIWTKFESPSPKTLCQVWLKSTQWSWSKRFLNFVNDFRYFVIISPWKRAWSFIWTNFDPLQPRIALHLKNLDSLHPRMLCAKKWGATTIWNLAPSISTFSCDNVAVSDF